MCKRFRAEARGGEKRVKNTEEKLKVQKELEDGGK